MSERITDDWALYEIASDLELWARLCKVNFSNKEIEYLQEYLILYKKYLNLHSRLLELEKKLPPPPRINDETIEYRDLKIEIEYLDKKINYLIGTVPLQNVLNYRFTNRTSSKPQIKKEAVQKAIMNQKELQKKEVQHKRMHSIKDKLANTFGVFGIIIYVLIRAIVYILPFVMIGGNFFFTLLLISINTFVPFASVVFWIWGLVCAIKGIQDIWAIIYYIAFAVIWLPFYISTIISLFSKKK